MKTGCIIVVGAALAMASLGSCASPQEDEGPHLAAARIQNDDAAKNLMREAEEAERNHNYAHALEVYRYLQGFPDATRPRDLDRRIRRDEAKMLESRQ